MALRPGVNRHIRVLISSPNLSNPILDLRREIRSCTRCPLHALHNGPVPPYVSSATPRILVLGEAPGRQEDRAVEPFVGPAGSLARRMLHEAAPEAPEPAWANVVCCWPARSPATPSRAEIDACRPNLEATLGVLSPTHVLAMGGVALDALLPGKKISEWRGQWWRGKVGRWQGWCLATFHPAAILRGTVSQRQVEADIAEFCFYALGVFDPPAREVEVKVKGKKVKKWIQQERLL